MIGIEEIRAIYSEEGCKWPKLGYFVHADAKDHIAALLAKIDEQAAEIKRLQEASL